jgi:hypothetical protein
MKNYFFLAGILLIASNAFGQTAFNLSPEMFGGKGDASVIVNCNMNAGSARLICQGGKFSDKDIHKIIFVNGAAPAGRTLISTIDSVISSDVIVLKNAAVQSVSDTATYGTDCTAAFLKINQEGRYIKDKKVTISFSHGTYLTKFNNWLAGIRNVTINGNAGSIMCTNGAYDPNGFPNVNVALFMPAVFDNVDNNYYESKWASNTSYGYKIKDAHISEMQIILQTKDSIVNFKAGNWVLIYGFEQENREGYPPDTRYFEYIKIKDTDPAKGIIRFTTSLKNNYDSGWPDSTWTGGTRGIGAPRVINCNRPTFNIIDTLRMNNLTFANFPGWTGKYANIVRNGRLQLYGIIDAAISNVHSSGLYISTAKKINFTNCTFSAQVEPDKELETLEFDGCSINQMVAARGIDTLRLFNTNFTDEFTISPRVAIVEGCHFSTTSSGSTAALAHIGFNGGTDLVKLGSNTWDCAFTNRAFLLGPGGITRLTVEKVLDKNTIILSNADWSAAGNGRQVVPGHTGKAMNGKTFTVTKVFQYASGIIAVRGGFSIPPVEGDVFVFSYIPKVIVYGKQKFEGTYSGNYKIFTNEKHIDELKDETKSTQ